MASNNPEPDEDEAAWAKASPRLKGIFTEALDDYFAERKAEGGDGGKDTPDKGDDGEDTDDADDDGGKPAGRSAGKRAGRSAAAAAAGTGADKIVSAKHSRQARPSGGSILDVLIGR